MIDRRVVREGRKLTGWRCVMGEAERLAEEVDVESTGEKGGRAWVWDRVVEHLRGGQT